MNNSTAVEMAKETTGTPIQLYSWNRNDPVEARFFENRRLEAAKPFRQDIKVRRKRTHTVETTEVLREGRDKGREHVMYADQSGVHICSLRHVPCHAGVRYITTF